MTSERGSSQATQPLIGMSLQSLFLLHHLNALEKLQAIITMSDLGESGRSIALWPDRTFTPSFLSGFLNLVLEAMIKIKRKGKLVSGMDAMEVQV